MSSTDSKPVATGAEYAAREGHLAGRPYLRAIPVPEGAPERPPDKRGRPAAHQAPTNSLDNDSPNFTPARRRRHHLRLVGCVPQAYKRTPSTYSLTRAELLAEEAKLHALGWSDVEIALTLDLAGAQ